MSYIGVVKFSEILKTFEKCPSLKKGCVVDTSILFAASYPLDNFNSESEEFFEFASELEIPLYTNVTVRSEFINNQRQVMIPEGLSDLYSSKKQLDHFLMFKLKIFYKTLCEARNTGKSYKFNETQIRIWRKMFIEKSHDEIDGWERFCYDYLTGRIENIWDITCDELGVRFLSLRDQKFREWLTGDMSWEGMSSIIGKFGIASSDAMIINLFLNSDFPALVTADNEIVYVLNKIAPEGKCVIIPDRMN